jgi:hypothetical protein
VRAGAVADRLLQLGLVLEEAMVKPKKIYPKRTITAKDLVGLVILIFMRCWHAVFFFNLI